MQNKGWIGAVAFGAGAVFLYSICTGMFSDKKTEGERLKADIIADCAVWEKRHGREETLPAGLLAELLDYAAREQYMDALAAYRDESLLCTVEELRAACPSYRTIIEQTVAHEQGKKERLDEERIYRLERNGKNCFLLFWDIYDAETVWMKPLLLEEGDNGWMMEGASGLYGIKGEFELFSRVEDGQKQYYVLCAYTNMLTICRLTNLPDGVFVDGETVKIIQTDVVSETLYRKRWSSLASQVEDYVQENLELFAWRYREGADIWGDEEMTQLPEEEFRADSYGGYVYADYDNDGKRELFYRDAERIGQVAEDDGAYQAFPAELDCTGMKRIWFAEFDGKVVTFQLLEQEPSGLVIQALIYEEGTTTQLYSGQVDFVRKAGVVDYTPAYWEAFDFNGVTVRKTQDIWLQPQIQERVQKEQEDRTIVPCRKEDVPFPEGLLMLLREQAQAGLYGRKSVYPQSCRVDLLKDTDLFLQQMGKRLREDKYYWECKWAYHWTAEDGSENFISCVNYSLAKDSIEWWKLAEGEVQEHAYIMETATDSQLIDYEGQLYCVTDFGRSYGARGGSSVEMQVIEMNRLEDWRATWFTISSAASELQDFTCIPLYEEEGLCREIRDYIEECYEAVGESCVNGSVELFSASGETACTKAQERILRNLSDGSVTKYAQTYYFTADIDNDGIMEYAKADWWHGWVVTFYEQENGDFSVIPFESVVNTPVREQETLAVVSGLSQVWCKELGGVTYLFTAENLWDSPDLVLRVRMLKEDALADKAVYLLKANMAETSSPWWELAVEPDEPVG